MNSMDAVREHLARVLDWQDAHVDFDTAVAGVPEDVRGAAPPGLPLSLWQLVEHIRIAQHDIYDFCVNPAYQALTWPADYWPAAAPRAGRDWDASIAAVRKDRDLLKQLAREHVDLAARIPHGTGQTYLRAILLAADHTAYHVGQIVLVRRLLGCWNGG